jgi:proteasome accessory factor B
MKKPPQAADRLSRPPLARMLRIHERLKGDRFPNCSQLALDLEVATKTVQRDIDFMRDRLDLPIEFDFRRNGFHYTSTVENFPTVQVTEQELIALFVAEKALAQYKGTPFEKPLHAAFQKLTEGLSDAVSFRWSDMDSAISFRSIGTTVADLELFETVSRVVLRSQELEFQYRKLGSTKYERRCVQPYHLGCIEHQWYLFAYDQDRQQMRTFVLARMRDVHPTGKRFSRPADFSLTKHLGDSFGVFKDGGKPQEIRIRFDSFAARLVRERQWHASQKIKELDNEEIELTLKLGNLPEIQRWVLSWGEHARVITPKELRNRVAKTVEALSATYKES